MNKKKVNNILKGVAGVGAALGGASVLGESDVVFAAEVDMRDEQTIEELEEAFESDSASAFESTSVSEVD